MTTFVLVHGAWHGGWWRREVAGRLRADGHVVYTPTLSGAWTTVACKMHILAGANHRSPFHAIHAGVASEPDWLCRRIAGPHDLMISHPEETVALLLEAAG